MKSDTRLASAPPISVLMSCYNSATWLAEAIESVLSQTFRDFEFIIVDDGSTDGSGAIVARYAENDRRIVAITKPNTGLADSLNVGLRKARGEWVARLDADDICLPNRLEKQFHFVHGHGDLVFVGSGLSEIDIEGQRSTTHLYPTTHSRLLQYLQSARKFPPHSSAFFRKKVAVEVGGYRTRLKRSQDRDLWLRLAEAGELASIPEPLVLIRKHPGQISHDEAGRRQAIDSKVALTSYWLRAVGYPDPIAGDEETFLRFRQWISNRFYEEKVFQISDYTRRMKCALAESTGSTRIRKVAALAVGHPSLLCICTWRLFCAGDSSRRWAARWISLSNA